MAKEKKKRSLKGVSAKGKVKKKKSLKERMRERREEVKRKGQRSNIIRQGEEGTLRVRIMNTGKENEFIIDGIFFWLGKGVGSVLSPATFGDPCALMEKFQELRSSDDEDDKDTAKKIMPKNRPLIPIIMYKDEKGKKVDEDNSGKLLSIANSVQQEILDLYLDEDEAGDMTDVKDGYDIKILREGLKMTDTNYSVRACRPTPIPKKWAKPVDLEEMVKAEIPTYEETVEKLDKFLNMEPEDDGDDKPKKKKKKGKKGKKSKKRGKDI